MKVNIAISSDIQEIKKVLSKSKIFVNVHISLYIDIFIMIFFFFYPAMGDRIWFLVREDAQIGDQVLEFIKNQFSRPRFIELFIIFFQK